MSSFVCLLFMIHYDLFGSSYARFYVSLLFIIRFYFFFFFLAFIWISFIFISKANNKKD